MPPLKVPKIDFLLFVHSTSIWLQRGLSWSLKTTDFNSTYRMLQQLLFSILLSSKICYFRTVLSCRVPTRWESMIVVIYYFRIVVIVCLLFQRFQQKRAGRCSSECHCRVSADISWYYWNCMCRYKTTSGSLVSLLLPRNEGLKDIGNMNALDEAFWQLESSEVHQL